MSYIVTDITTEKLNATFKLMTIDCEVANRFRQTLMRDIPTIAIDSVEVYENDSPHHDEYLTHRLGLIPIMFTEEVNLEDIIFELRVYAVTDVLNVTSKFLKSNTGLKPVDDDVLICKLFKGQTIDLKAHIKLGTSKTHSKWCPVTNVSWRLKEDHYLFNIEILGSIDAKLLIEKAVALLNGA